MKERDVPQDSDNSTYGGERKVIYALNDSGNFVGVKSSGWEAEADATNLALEIMHRACEEAWERACAGETAPLEYYMRYRRMDLALLAQTSGFSRWRIRRHMRPSIYRKLGDRLLRRYSEALELDLKTLRTLPDKPLHESV